MTNTQQDVWELKTKDGELVGYQCPVCNTTKISRQLAEQCAKEHASILCD